MSFEKSHITAIPDSNYSYNDDDDDDGEKKMQSNAQTDGWDDGDWNSIENMAQKLVNIIVFHLPPST